MNLASQLLLAWFISERAFGIMAMATTAMSFTQLIQNFGLREVLIQRSHKIRIWVNHAQHLAIAIGGLASLAMAASAPVFATMYREPALAGVVLVISGAPLFRSLANVSQAVLRASMRFKTVATIELIDTLMLAGVAIPLAALGLEEYALAIPVTASALVRVVVSSRMARVRPHWPVRPRRWRMLIRSGGVLAFTRVFTIVVQQCDYIFLSLFHPAAVVGVYYYAYNLSIQSVRVLNANVVGVMLPTLSTIATDRQRSMRALLRSLAAISVLGVPFAILQVALIEPVRLTLFPDRWPGLSAMVQVLSVGMLFSVIGNTSTSLLMAQRRFGSVLRLSMASSALALALVLPAAFYGAAFEVACAVMAFRVIMSPIWIYVAVRPSGGGWGDVYGVFAGPLLVGLLAAGAGGGTAWLVTDAWPVNSWLGSLTTLIVFLPLYTVGVRVVCPKITGEMLARGRSMARRIPSRVPWANRGG